MSYERVNPSHPDKVADRIAGALVDYCYQQQRDTMVATRSAVRLAGSWRDDLRDVRCNMEDGRWLTGVGSLVFIKNLRIDTNL